MQKAILVKNGSDVISKLVYSGGGETFEDYVDSELARLEAAYPSYTFTLYESDLDSEFASATIDVPTEII